MKRERIFINAFIITILLIAILATFCSDDVLENIVYALILPVFFISLIEFIIEIRDLSENQAQKYQEDYKKLADIQKELAELKEENFRLLGKTDNDGTGEKEYNEATANIIITTDYIKVQSALKKLEKVLGYFYIVILIFFFISIIFSNMVVKYLRILNLNCVTLWSLLLVLISTYYKKEFSIKVISKVKKHYENKRNKE